MTGVVGWTAALLVVLVALDAYSPELFFVVSLIGLLVVTELTAPVVVVPPWRRRVRWLVVAGLVVFGAVVIRRVLLILEGSL